MPVISSNAARPIRAPRASCASAKLRRKMRSRERAAAPRREDTGSGMLDRYGYATHEVLNQPPPLDDYDAFASDDTLRGGVRAFGAESAEPKLERAGRSVGSAPVQHLARQANRHTPERRTHDRFGNRVDEVEFPPPWHE